MTHARSFAAGVLLGAVVIVPLGAYLFARFGGIAMATTAKPLPLEATFAKTALRASTRNAANVSDPLQLNELNLTSGAQAYVENCAVCHGVPGQPKSRIAAGEFPPPPQLFDSKEMVTHDPEGVTHWKIAHGIRLSGMPGFGSTLSDTTQWQLTMLLAHADNLPAGVTSVLTKPGCGNNAAVVSAAR